MNVRRAATAALLTAAVAAGTVAVTAAPASAEPNGGPGTCATMGSLFEWYYARWQFWVTMADIDKQLGATDLAQHASEEASFWHNATTAESRAGQRAGCW